MKIYSSTGPIGPTGRRGPKGDTGPAGSSIISFIPFASGNMGFTSTTYSDGSPAQVGIAGLSIPLTTVVEGGLNGTVTIPSFYQYGFVVPAACVLDSIYLSVGNPEFTSEAEQITYAFAALATAEANSQEYTIHASTAAKVAFAGGLNHAEQISMANAAKLGLFLATGTRCIVVCGHYTTGSPGPTSFTFSHAGTLLFK